MSRHELDKPLVMTADDDPVTSQILLMYLESSGFDVIGAADGSAAIELAAERLPDAVILDYNLPPTTGADVARALRDNPATSHAGIALLTASPELADNPDQAELWDARLTKPIDQESLAAVVTEMIAGARAEVAAAADQAAPLPEDPIQAEFVSRLRTKLDEMRDLVRSDGLPSEPGSPLRVLRRHLGQLQGSAGVCGFPEIGAAASEAAKLLDRCIDGTHGSAVEDELARVRESIEHIAALAGWCAGGVRP
jgi:DNA-binding response OmpR family regulator